MPIAIVNNSKLDERLDLLAKAQPVRVSRTSLAIAILENACASFEASGQPEAWRHAAPAIPSQAQQESTADLSIRDQPPTSHGQQPATNGTGHALSEPQSAADVTHIPGANISPRAGNSAATTSASGGRGKRARKS